jgi:hypothetical protein
MPSKVRRELPNLPDRQLNLKVRGPALNLGSGTLEQGGFEGVFTGLQTSGRLELTSLDNSSYTHW